MNAHTQPHNDSARYARCAATSKRVRWDIDKDVIRGRGFDFTKDFLPAGLSLVGEIDGLSPAEQRYLGQVQGRTYANMFGVVERFINAKVLEVAQEDVLGDQDRLEALVGFSVEEMKHQALFRRIEAMIARDMAPGYVFVPQPDPLAEAVLSKGNWAVLALTLHIELFTQAHYRQSIDANDELSELYRDVFRYHWMEESQHAILDELELRREHARLDAGARDQGVTELIELVAAVDGILQAQAAEDTRYFAETCGRELSEAERAAVGAGILKAYRQQYIFSGVAHPHFQKVMGELTTPEQMTRIAAALATIQ
jgi:hypothetical protein